MREVMPFNGWSTVVHSYSELLQSVEADLESSGSPYEFDARCAGVLVHPTGSPIWTSLYLGLAWDSPSWRLRLFA
jgi:hypothetical protein